MASHSEISLVNPAEPEATPVPKPGKKRARNAPSRKTGKQSTARKKSKQYPIEQPASGSVVPVMKLRAVDIVDVGNTMATQHAKTGEQDSELAGDERSHIFQMPPPVAGEVGGDQVNTGPGPDQGIEIPTGADGEPLVTDPELLELLEQLSTTIDTANTVLEVASGAPAQEGADFNPKPEPLPQPEPEPDDPPPAAQGAAPSPPEPAARRSNLGLGLVANAAITGLILAAGTAWLIYTNPWLLDGQPGTPAELEQTVSAPPVEGRSEPAPAAEVLKNTVTTPNKDSAPFAPPNEDPAPMETATPPAPSPDATATRQIRVSAGQSAPLGIALPAMPDQTEISVMIRDVPEAAKLSAGRSLGAGNWLLDETQLNNLNIVTGEGLAPGAYQLEVIFVRSDGKVPETRNVSLSVQPAASEASASASAVNPAPETAGPDTGNPGMSIVKTGVAVAVPAAPRGPPVAAKPLSTVAVTPELPQLSKSEINSILTRGGKLLNEGDIAGARLLLEYAAERGSKTAMVRLGESYDPKYLEKLGAQGVQPDSAQAALWYNRASVAQ